MMPRSVLSCRRMFVVPIAAAAAFAVLGGPVSAQGTPEQREACAPDAIKLCSNTIPDVGRTTACMKAHSAELSPRCRAVFAAATEPPPPDEEPPPAKPHRKRVARAAPPPDDDDTPPAPRGRRYGAPDDWPDEPPRGGRPPDPYERGPYSQAYDDDVDRARAIIGHLCDDQMIDPRTCAVTERALGQTR